MVRRLTNSLSLSLVFVLITSGDALAQSARQGCARALVSDAGRHEGFVGSVQENEKAQASRKQKERNAPAAA